MAAFELKKINDYVWELPKQGEMRVPGRIYGDERIIDHLLKDSGAAKEWNALSQLHNVATLPGIVKVALAMPDIHPGYGFPIGGVAAFDPKEGVVAMGGVGFDINCGVRTLRTPLKKADVEARKEQLADRLFRDVPAGLGSTGEVKLSMKEIDQVLLKGAEFAIERGYGFPEDLEYTEERGRIANCNPQNVSSGAKERQFQQVGTLGSGNHYLEVQYVEEIYDEQVAKVYGIERDQILVAIHCGSRALGHQIGQDYLQELERASKKYGIPIRERELVCAPIESPEGERYITAMNCGINCAFANRQTLAHLVRRSFGTAFGLKSEQIKMLYDVGHNTAKFETHEVDGSRKRLLVHRKGATRAFGPGREENPAAYRNAGHPIFIGGTMGTYSYIMRGTELGLREAFGSGIHGAGREMSREKAKKQFRGEQLREELKKQGIIIRGHSMAGLAEEAPGAYKDIEMVAEAAHNSGVNRKVARLRPLVVVKG
jgi:tRNA-splicing ligase RtcB